MPRGKKYGGRDFKPGNPGGPGRKPLPPELKEARKLTAQLFQDAVNKMAAMSPIEIQNYIKNNPNCTMLEAAIAGQFGAALKGKSTPLDLLLNRTVGPVKQLVQIDGSISAKIESMSEEEKAALVKKLDEQ